MASKTSYKVETVLPCAQEDFGVFNYTLQENHDHNSVESIQGDHINSSLVLKDIVYTVSDSSTRLSHKVKNFCKSNKKLTVLKNINLQFSSGKLTAMLGSSGSGKTSLFDVIAQRHNGTVNGSVFLNDSLLTKEVFRNKCGYVVQSDSLTSMPNLTAYETLWYIALLKFSKEHNTAYIKNRVKSVMQDMKLWHVRNVKVGGLIIRGLSGGEKRRTCIAAQLLQNPDILLLDEPTTGLDSFTSHDIVLTLSELAHKHKKLVCLTIHQPRSDIFQILDKVGIMSSGKMIYFGDRDELLAHFASLGYRCPEYSNPLDFAIDLASIDRRSLQEETFTANRVENLKMQYLQSELYKTMTCQSKDVGKRSGQAANENDDTVGNLEISPKKHFKPLNCFVVCKDFLVKMLIILRRLMMNISKDIATLVLRSFQLPMMALILYAYCGSLGADMSSIQDRNGIVYMTISVPPMCGIVTTAAIYPSLMKQYELESTDGLYGSVPFLVAYYIHILPFNIIAAVLYSTILYWSVGLYPELVRFLKFLTVVFISGYLGELLGVMLLGIFKKSSLSQSVGTLMINSSLLLASGLIVATSSLLLPLQWLTYTSFIKYSTEILVGNEFDSLEFICDEKNGTESNCFDGDNFIDLFYPNAQDHEGRNFGLLCLNIVVFWISNFFVY